MPILNQTRTGKSVPREVAQLKRALDGREGGPNSSMQEYVSIHCMTLAMVLDSVEALENFLEDQKRNQKRINAVG